jgi:hypothetical protein
VAGAAAGGGKNRKGWHGSDASPFKTAPEISEQCRQCVQTLPFARANLELHFEVRDAGQRLDVLEGLDAAERLGGFELGGGLERLS